MEVSITYRFSEPPKEFFTRLLPVVGVDELLVVVFGVRFIEQPEMDAFLVPTAVLPDLFAMDGRGIGTGVDLHIDIA